ncbi:MAG: MBL fold metallo-hydrolase [Kiritimatiellia bacterium]
MHDDTTEIAIIVNNIAGCPGLISEHGFSMYIKTGPQRIIFDTGQESYVFANNARKLGIDMRSIKTVVLSHGHYDHTGGMPGVVAACGTFDLYAHPEVMSTRYSVRPERVKSNGIPLEAHAAIQSLPARSLHWSAKSVNLTNNVGLTGYIPRETNYEDSGGPFFFDQDGDQLDPINDDQALWIKTEKGLIICTGCCHAGIINTLRHVQRLSGCEKIRAVIGGLHLVNASAERITKTMVALNEFQLELIVPCHCTGATATELIQNQFKERATSCAAGRRFCF